MSAFPTKILLATDSGSEDAALAARAAVDLAAEAGGSPLNTGTEQEREKEARKVLDYQVSLIEEAGAEVAEAHARR